MKMKRFLSLVISTAMTFSAFGGFVTSASAEVTSGENTVSWFASASDGTPIEGADPETQDCATIAKDTDLMSGTDCELIIMGDGCKFKKVEFKGTDEAGSDVETPAGLTGRLNNAGRGDASDFGTTGTGLKFTAKADGVIDVYAKVNNGKTFVVNKADGSERTSWVNNEGKNSQKRISAPVKASETYYIYAESSGLDLFGLVFRQGAEYVPPVITSKEPATPKPVETLDPNAKVYEWNVSENDLSKKTGDLLMTGLSMLFDNYSTNKKYISDTRTEGSGKITDGVASGSSLKFVAPEDGKLEVTMIDVGDVDKQITPVIYDAQARNDVFTYTTAGTGKETVNLSADVEAGKTYYITATGTKGRFSAAKFTPASQGGDATTAPDVTDAPNNTDTPSTGTGITYADGTVTVKTDKDIAAGTLIIASYDGNKLSNVETKPLTFTNGVATVSNLALINGTKLMAWKDIKSMEPICPSAVVSGSSVTQAPATQAPTAKPTREPISVPEETDIAQVPTGNEAVYIGETQYNTITEALAAAPTAASEAERVYIDVMPGVYREQIKVTKPYITIRKKAGTDGNVKLTWYYGQGSTYYSCKDGFYTADKQATGGVPSNWGATLNVPKDGLGFTAENLILENSYNRYYTQEELTDLAGHDPGEGNSNFKRLDWLNDQIAAGVSDDVINTKLKTRESDIDGKYDGAGKNTKYSPRERCAALYTNADKIQIKNCLVISTQDTIGINDNRVYFENCRLGGTTDYICGSAPGAVFNNCELYTNAGRDGEGATITAPSNRANTNGYLFWNCRINGTDTAIDGSMGRPWSGNNAGAAYINTVIETSKKDSSKLLVGAAGWSAMSGNKPEDAHFHEFGSVKEDGTPVDVSKRVQGTVLGEWEVLAYNPYKFLKGTDDWDPMGVKEIWTKVQEDVNAVTISDSDTIKKQDDGSYEVSGEFTLPTAPAGYDIHFESDSEYLTVNGNTVTAVRPITGTSEGALIVYLRKTDDKTTGASAKINVTITADNTVDPAAFNEAMTDAKSAVTALMGSEESIVLDRAVPVPTVADKGDVKTTIKIETEGKVNGDGTIARNPYASEKAEGKVTYIIECQKGATLLRDTIAYNVTIPSKKGDLLYADFEDGNGITGGTVKADGNNSSYYVNGAISADFAKASSKSPVTVEFDVKKADTTVTVGKYAKTIEASAMQEGWNKVTLVIDTAAKTMTTSVNGTALGEAETVAEGDASVSKLTLTAGDYDNITVFEGENNADGAKVYTTIWKASEADNGKPTGSILMRGMTVTDTITTLKAASDTVDGETFTHFVSSGNNGSYKNNKFSGTGIGLKLVAPADGKWTVYVTGLKTKTFAVGSNEDATVTKTTTGTAAGIATSLTIDVESGKTYYATVDGSKGSFLGAKFVPTVEGGAAEEPEKPIENAISIKIKLTNGNFLTEEEKTNKTAVSFGVNKDGARVAADAADALVVFNNVKYHSDDHGFNPGTATIKVPSYTRVSVGGCNWGSDVKLKVNGADYATESSKIACWNETNNSVAELYYKDAEEATLEISGGGYWPYIAFESITEKQLPSDVTATFELGSSDAQGVVPDKKTVIKGASITIPANRTLYKEGNTLTGWTDGTNTYAIGQEVTLTDNMALTPVFTSNTKTLADTSVVFDFQRQNGAPTVGWENVSGKFWVGQATVDGTPIDVKMDIDTTTKTLHDGTTTGNGKVANANWVDWAQINQCTEFTVPAVAGSVIEIAAMGADTKLEIGANQFNKDAGYTVKAEDITDGKVKMLNVGGGYTRTIKVTYPAASTPADPTATPTAAPVDPTATPTAGPIGEPTATPTVAPVKESAFKANDKITDAYSVTETGEGNDVVYTFHKNANAGVDGAGYSLDLSSLLGDNLYSKKGTMTVSMQFQLPDSAKKPKDDGYIDISSSTAYSGTDNTRFLRYNIYNGWDQFNYFGSGDNRVAGGIKFSGHTRDWYTLTATINITSQTLSVVTTAGSETQTYAPTEFPNALVDGKLYMNVIPTRSANDANEIEFSIKNITVSYEKAPDVLPATVTAVNGTDETKTTKLGGEVSVDKAAANEGETVTITAAPYYGFEVSAVKVSKDGASAETIAADNGVYSFEVEAGAEEYTVTAEFTPMANKKILYFMDSTIDGSIGSIRDDKNLKVMNYVKTGAATAWAAQDLKLDGKNPIGMQAILTRNGDPQITLNISGTDVGTAQDLVLDESTKFKAAATDYFAAPISITGATFSDSDALKVTVTSKSGSDSFLGNYWYIVLEYAE